MAINPDRIYEYFIEAVKRYYTRLRSELFKIENGVAFAGLHIDIRMEG